MGDGQADTIDCWLGLTAGVISVNLQFNYQHKILSHSAQEKVQQKHSQGALPHFHEMFDDDDIISISAATKNLLFLRSHIIILHTITHSDHHTITHSQWCMIVCNSYTSTEVIYLVLSDGTSAWSWSSRGSKQSSNLKIIKLLLQV